MTEIKLKSGETVKAYPLTGSQNMMYLMSLKYGSGYPVNNIGCGYYWQGDYNKGEMKASIYEAIRRCDNHGAADGRDEELPVELFNAVVQKIHRLHSL